jgi:hypothetical protein
MHELGFFGNLGSMGTSLMFNTFHLELGTWRILRWKFGNFNMLNFFLSVKPYTSTFHLT